MKTWKKALLCLLLPFAFIKHGVQKSARYIERKAKPAIAMLIAVTMMLSVFPLQAQAVEVGEWFTSEGVIYGYVDDGIVGVSTKNQKNTFTGDSLVIPETVEYNGTTYTVTTIGDDAFNSGENNGYTKKPFTSITLPDTITELGKTSFASTKLTSFTVPPLVEKIPEWIFSGCYDLRTVTITRTDKVVALEATNAFNAITDNVTIRVPVGMEDDYRNAANWSSMKSRITDGVRLISFDGGGAEGEMETGSVPDGQAYTLPVCSFTAPAGHQFKAWKIDNQEYAPGASFTPTGDVTATAVWEVGIYNVTLNANGGTIANGKNIISYTYGTTTELPDQSEITYAGHTFAGWYEASDFSGEAVTAITATDEGDKNYYAKWDHIFNTQKNDDMHHWNECVCGEQDTKESHIGGKYSAPDNTITDICTVCDVSLGTATISAESSKYSGNPCAGASVSTTGTLKDLTFTVTYIGRDGTIYNSTTPPTNAGKYSATISIGESENKQTASVDFSIEKATAVVTAPVANAFTYTGTAQALVTAGAAEGGTIYYKLDDGEWTTDIPTAINANVYTVYYKVVGDNNHEDTEEKSISVTIADKTNPTGEILIKDNGWGKFWNWISFGLFCKDTVDVTVTADGTGSAVVKVEYLFSATALDENNVPTDGWLEISADNGKYNFSIRPQNKGAVYVRITDEGGNVTVINSDGIVVYEESKAVDTKITYTYKENSNKNITVKFNGNTVKSIVCGGKNLAAGIDYSVDYENSEIVLSASYLDTLDVDDYSFAVSYNPMGVADSGVTDLTTTFTVIIGKADGEVSNISISGKTYDGTAVTAPTFDKLGDGAVTIEYKQQDADDSTYTTTAPSAAGDYIVRVTVVESGNYKGASETTGFTIGRATITDVSVEPDGKLTYNGGTAVTPTVSANAVAVNDQLITFAYSTAENGIYGSMPSFIEADTYTVYYKVTAPNHSEAKGSFTVTVNKAAVDVPTLASKVYNGSNQTADISDTEPYTVTQSGGTDVGKYDVVLTLKDSNNYKWETTDSATVTLNFEIIKANAAVKMAPTAKSNLVYNGAKQELITAGTANGGEMQYSLDGEHYSADIPEATNADTYTVYYKVVGDSNHYGTEAETLTVIIDKMTVDLSDVKWDYTEPFKYDGLTHGVAIDESTLPYGASVSGYTGNSYVETGSRQAAASIIYDGNHKGEATLLFDWAIVNDWTPAEYTVSGEGWMNTDFVITPADGYLISLTNTATGGWKDSLTYSAETDNGSVTFYLKNNTDGTISLAKTVNYKIDKTVPTGRVEFEERNGWETFLNTISFGLFYKDEVTVKVTANDDLSGVAKIEYASSDKAMTLNEVKEIADWTEYNGSFGVTKAEAEKFVYFIRITDNAGNVTYLSTDGAQYDTTAPVISGVENGKTYYTTQKVTVTDENIESITLNGETLDNEITLDGNKEATYTIVVTDKAGNKTTVIVTMKPIVEFGTLIDNIIEDEVKSSDKDTIQNVIEIADELLSDDDLTDDEKAALEEIKSEAEKLVDKIDEVAKATDTENTEKVEDVTMENVTPEDKTDLEKAKADLEKALEDNGGNYTDDEKKAVEDEIKRIDDALEVIDNVEEAEELIDKLPAVDTVKPDDEEAIKAITDAQTVYNALSDYEKSLVDEDTKAKLDKLVAALVVYDIVEGDGSSWTEDSDHSITFVVNGLFSKFVGIKVDGKNVDKANYEVKAGSTIITLKASYLDALKVGEHTITVVYTDGSIDGSFNVHANANSPATGDNSNIWLWFALLFVSGAGVFGITLYDRKRKAAGK